MKDQGVPADDIVYVNAYNHNVLTDGEIKHALDLAQQFGMTGTAVEKPTLVTHFDDDYNFADKILPVWRISSQHTIYYVETASGGLSKEMKGHSSYEAMSFALLHKHEFLSPLGKRVKDFSTMFWAASQIVMIGLGIVLFVKLKSRAR